MTLANLTDPITQFCLLVAGFLLSHLVLRGHSTLKFVSRIAFFVLLTALLIFHGIEPYTSDTTAESVSRRIFIGTAKAIWWIGGAMVLVSSVRVFLIFEHKPREVRLLQDLVVGLIYLGAGLSVVAY